MAFTNSAMPESFQHYIKMKYEHAASSQEMTEARNLAGRHSVIALDCLRAFCILVYNVKISGTIHNCIIL